MGKFSYKNKPLGLYLHIPFCVSKCGYCDFYSVTDESLMKGYVSALLSHIREYGRVCGGYTVDTVYLGGGTPSCLGPKYLTRILQEVKNKFVVDEDAEITVEGNPESTDKKLLEMARVFRMPVWKRIHYIYVPALLPYLVNGCRTALGMSWKSGVAAEVIGIPEGSIGEQLYYSKLYLDTAGLFAWTFVIIVISALFERFFLYLLRKIKH